MPAGLCKSNNIMAWNKSEHAACLAFKMTKRLTKLTKIDKDQKTNRQTDRQTDRLTD